MPAKIPTSRKELKKWAPRQNNGHILGELVLVLGKSSLPVNREAVRNHFERLSNGTTEGLEYLYEEPPNNDDDE